MSLKFVKLKTWGPGWQALMPFGNIALMSFLFCTFLVIAFLVAPHKALPTSGMLREARWL